jgi:hypothetical protein
MSFLAHSLEEARIELIVEVLVYVVAVVQYTSMHFELVLVLDV